MYGYEYKFYPILITIGILFSGIDGEYVPLYLVVDTYDHLIHITIFLILTQVYLWRIYLTEIVIKVAVNHIIY